MDITDDIVMEAITQLIRELYERHKRPLHIRVDSIAERIGSTAEDVIPRVESLIHKGAIRYVRGLNVTFIALNRI